MVNESQFKISVVIPMYNASKTIERCLDSVLEQTYLPYEIIIINDGSTDDSRAVVEEYIKRNTSKLNIQLINQKNSGVSSARNRGIKESKGDWIAFLDSDDIWVKNKLEIQTTFIVQLPYIGLLGGGFENKLLKETIKYKEITFDQLLYRNYFATPTVLINKSKLKFYFDEHKKYSEDYLLWLNILKNERAIYINENLAYNIDGKMRFGDYGLSSNLMGMEKEELKNYFILYNDKAISFFKFLFLSVFSLLKFIRRMALSKANLIIYKD